MRLTDDQKQSVLKKLGDFFKKKCECGSNEWILNDKIFELREFQGGNLIIGGQSSVFPVITVSCKQCGNTYFFNAVLLSVIEKK